CGAVGADANAWMGCAAWAGCCTGTWACAAACGCIGTWACGCAAGCGACATGSAARAWVGAGTGAFSSAAWRASAMVGRGLRADAERARTTSSRSGGCGGVNGSSAAGAAGAGSVTPVRALRRRRGLARETFCSKAFFMGGFSSEREKSSSPSSGLLLLSDALLGSQTLEDLVEQRLDVLGALRVRIVDEDRHALAAGLRE